MYEIIDLTKNFNFKIHSEKFFEDFKHVLTTNKKVLIIDYIEADAFWPIQKYGRNVIDVLTGFFKNFDNDVYYVTADLSAIELYEKYLKENNLKKKIHIVIYPFSTLIKDMSGHLLEKEFMKRLNFSYNSLIIDKTKKINFKINKNFICLISKPKNYRLIFLNNLINYKYFEYSLSHTNEKNSILENDLDYHRLSKNIISDKTNPFKISCAKNKNLSEFSQFYYEDDKLILEDLIHYVPIEFLKSNVNIVCESYCEDSVMYTEKTWKSIYYGKPFLILGAKNQNVKLKQLGFFIYDDVFNYEFDRQDDIITRMNMLILEIKKFINLNPEDFKKILKKIEYKVVLNKKTYEKILVREKDYINCCRENNSELIEQLINKFG